MDLSFDYLIKENIPIAATTNPHAIRQTLIDAKRSTLILGEDEDAVDLGICYLSNDASCLFRAELTSHPTPAYFFINTIERTSDALQSSWTLYFNTPTKRDASVPDFIELPLSWFPDVKNILEDKTLITLTPEDKLNIQKLVNLQDKNQLALNLFNRGFNTLFEKHEFTSEERRFYLEYIQKNTNHSSPSYLKIAEYNERKKELGFELTSFNNNSYIQIYRAIVQCSLLLSSIEPSIENLSQFSIDFQRAYIRYEEKLYFIDQKQNQCTLIIDGHDDTQQTLLRFDQAVKCDRLFLNQSRKLKLNELKAIRSITSHSFDCASAIEFGLHAHYDYCEPVSVFSESRSTIQCAENGIIETLSDFFDIETCLHNIIEHLADYTSETKIRLNSRTVEEDQSSLSTTYESFSELETKLNIIAQQFNVFILLIKTNLFYQTANKAQEELYDDLKKINENTEEINRHQKAIDKTIIESKIDILGSYKEKIINFLKFKLRMLSPNIEKIDDLTQALFTTPFSDIYYQHPYRKSLLLSIEKHTEEFKILLDTLITDKTSEAHPFYKMKEKLQCRITLEDLNSELFQFDFGSLPPSDEQETLAISFMKAKNKLIEILQEKERFTKISKTLIEKIENIKKAVDSSAINSFLSAIFRRKIAETSHQVSYTLSNIFHLVYKQEKIQATLTSQFMSIFSKGICMKKHTLDAFQEEQAVGLRKRLLTSSSFYTDLDVLSYSDLFKLITFSDLSVFSEEQQLYLLNRFSNTHSDQKTSSSALFHDDCISDCIDSIYSVLHLKNCATLTTELLKKILLINKNTLSEIYIENCPNIDNESIKLFSNKKLRLTKITLDNLPHLEKIVLKNIEKLTHLNIKNCPSLAYVKIRSSCLSLNQERLDFEACPNLTTVLFKISKLQASTRKFCDLVDKKQHKKADEAFMSIKSLNELNSVSLIYALGTWGLSENEKNPERILNAIRLLLCVTNAYKKFTHLFLSKLDGNFLDISESKFSDTRDRDCDYYAYSRMTARIMNMSGITCLPDAFLEILKKAGNPGPLLFDFRNVNITDYQPQINTMIQYLKSFLKEGEPLDTLPRDMLDRCETDIPDESLFSSDPASFDETQPTPFRLLVTPEQKKLIEIICIKQIKDMMTLELDSPVTLSLPSVSQTPSIPDEDGENPLDQSGSSSASSSTSSSLNHSVLFPSPSAIPTLPAALQHPHQ